MIAQGAEEAVNPGRDVPLAIIISTSLCTVLYAAASAVVVGLRPYNKIGSAPFADGEAWGKGMQDQQLYAWHKAAMLHSGSLEQGKLEAAISASPATAKGMYHPTLLGTWCHAQPAVCLLDTCSSSKPAAFRAIPGYSWVAYVVSAAAVFETLNTVFACLYGASSPVWCPRLPSSERTGQSTRHTPP